MILLPWSSSEQVFSMIHTEALELQAHSKAKNAKSHCIRWAVEQQKGRSVNSFMTTYIQIDVINNVNDRASTVTRSNKIATR